MHGEEHHEAATAEVEERIRESFGHQGLMTLLGARITAVARGRVQIELERRPEVTQQHGFVHAGATSAIADTAGGYAGLTMFPEGSDVLTVEYKINLLAPATGDHIEAVGTVLRSGRTLTVCRLDVTSIDGDRRTSIAVGQQTLIRLDATAGAG